MKIHVGPLFGYSEVAYIKFIFKYLYIEAFHLCLRAQYFADTATLFSPHDVNTITRNISGQNIFRMRNKNHSKT